MTHSFVQQCASVLMAFYPQVLFPEIEVAHIFKSLSIVEEGIRT
jgi:hypothetical protein